MKTEAPVAPAQGAAPCPAALLDDFCTPTPAPTPPITNNPLESDAAPAPTFSPYTLARKGFSSVPWVLTC